MPALSKKVPTMNTTPAILATLIGPAQRTALWAALEGEERDHFADIVTRLVATWQAMPATYATESQGRAAVAHLHYFLGGADWWIIEKDADPDNAGQIQAFGIADLGMGRNSATSASPNCSKSALRSISTITPKPLPRSSAAAWHKKSAGLTGPPWFSPAAHTLASGFHRQRSPDSESATDESTVHLPIKRCLKLLVHLDNLPSRCCANHSPIAGTAMPKS